MSRSTITAAVAPLVLVLTLCASAAGQLPITLSGSFRLGNLTNPDAQPFIPGTGAPASYVQAYGHTGPGLPSSYPALPPGFNVIGGFSGRMTWHGNKATHWGLRTIFYVEGATPFAPSGTNPLVHERTLTGTWVIYLGPQAAPTGTASGSFVITVQTLPGPVMTAGGASGWMVMGAATGALAGAGTLGAIHDLQEEPNTFPNWLNNYDGTSGTGGDVLFLSVKPRERLLPQDVYAVPFGGTDGTVADITGDQRPEILVVEEGAATVNILTNDGNGLFTTGAALSVGADPVRLAAGLVDADGLTDLVVACRGAGGIEVHPGAGGGTFGAPSFIPLPGVLNDVAVRDLNGDGRAEIFCALGGGPVASGRVRLLVNDGTGAFPTFLDVTTALERPERIHLDSTFIPGGPNLFVSDADTLFAPTSAAIRLYQVTTTSVTYLGAVPTGPEPRGLAVTDLDLDEQRDLVVARLGDPILGVPGAVEVFPGTGPALFGPAIPVLTSVYAVDVAAADFYLRDGKGDVLACALDQSSGMLLTDWMGGGFAGMGAFSLSSPALRVLTADLDGTGFPDLITFVPSAGEVVVRLAVPAADGEAYGTGCAGSFGLVPRIAMGRYPNLGNDSFELQLRDALPGAQAYLFLSLYPANVALPGSPPGCGLMISFNQPWFIPLSGMGGFVLNTDSQGYAAILLGIPPSPAFDFIQGLNVFAQWAVWDPGASLPTTPPVALTGGLRVTLY